MTSIAARHRARRPFKGLARSTQAPAPLAGSPATANRRVLDAQHRLGELVLAHLGQRVQVAPDELASVVRALLSRLDVSLSALMHEG